MISYESFHSLDELNEWQRSHKVKIINIETNENRYYMLRVWYKY